jgi:transposase
LISVDSTSILAHQHFAGARFHDHPGTRPNDKDVPANRPTTPRGRSHGVWTTKIHALTDELYAPVATLLSADQAGDKRLLADKAHADNSTREQLRALKIKHTIPEGSDQITYHKR